jgi:hypothetical protein
MVWIEGHWQRCPVTEGDSPTITFVLRTKGRTVREAALRRSRSERRLWAKVTNAAPTTNDS